MSWVRGLGMGNFQCLRMRRIIICVRIRSARSVYSVSCSQFYLLFGRCSGIRALGGVSLFDSGSADLGPSSSSQCIFTIFLCYQSV